MPAPDTFATKSDAQALLACVQTDLARRDYIDPALSEVSFAAYAAN